VPRSGDKDASIAGVGHHWIKMLLWPVLGIALVIAVFDGLMLSFYGPTFASAPTTFIIVVIAHVVAPSW
jgi:hypothetical protein